MGKHFNASSVRLARYLYALGFNKERYINSNGRENWRFEHTRLLQDALDFYFMMRGRTGGNEIGKNESTQDSEAVCAVRRDV